MRKELDDQLCREFPNLYRDRRASMMETLMCWGFCVGDGWFNIIYDMSKKLEALILEMPEKERQNYKAVQIKEKFGGLRVYLFSETKEMEEIISEAEKLCDITCEKCGAEGRFRSKGWCIVLCDNCDNQTK